MAKPPTHVDEEPKIFTSLLLVLGSQAFASMTCDGTVYLKLPEGWTSAYAIAGGNMVAFEKSDYDGWLSIQASAIGGRYDADGFNINESAGFLCGENGHCISPRSMNDPDMTILDNTGFNCADLKKTGELWISSNSDPDLSTTPYYSSTPPDVKYFYVFLPNTDEWIGSIPYMSVDGKTGEPLSVTPDHCGWYYKRYVGEVPPSNVLIYRDDDETMAEAIGMGGSWETASKPVPIDLKGLFEKFESDKLYFVADEDYSYGSSSETRGWTTSDPVSVSGNCEFDLAALIYDTDASLHGAFTCTPDWSESLTDEQAKYNACYYSSAPYNVVSTATGVVPCVGVTTGMVTDILPEDRKPALTTKGKKCFGSQADEAFKAMFNYTNGINENYCVTIPFSQDNDGRYEFNSDYYWSKGAGALGGFYPAEQAPTDFVYGTNPLPAAEVKRKAEGPVYMCADYNNIKSATPEGLRTIDKTEGVPVSNLICNGPGWDGGVDCDGHFANGFEFGEPTRLNSIGEKISKTLGVTFSGDGWSWSCPNEAPIGWTYYKDGTETSVGELARKLHSPNGSPRWTSGDYDSKILTKGGRNQHFCFESHAKFRYKKGLRFSVRGDDDIWVYIDNKLAVDLGGTHLPAPGYVNLDKFVGNSGSWTVGETYPIDIFFCDRRTTMSNFSINTNMYIKQTKGPRDVRVDKKRGNDAYTLQFCSSGDGSCAAAAMSSPYDGCLVGDALCADLARTGETVDYRIENKDDKVIKSAKELAQSTIYFGGIDLTNRCDPKIDKSAITGLAPGTYYLIVTVRGKEQQFQFKVSDKVDVVAKSAVAIDENGKKLPETFKPVSSAMGSVSSDNRSRIPVYVSTVVDQGDSALLNISEAVGLGYTLDIKDSAGKTASDVLVEIRNARGEYVAWPGSETRSVGKSGVDTVYISIPLSKLERESQSYTVSVSGRAQKMKVTFVVPRLVFVDGPKSTKAVTGDPDTLERKTATPYSFNLLAIVPSTDKAGTYDVCSSCNFGISVGSKTSAGLVVDTVGMKVVDGRAKISVSSTKEYRAAAGGDAANPATLSINGPSASIVANYSPLFFSNESSYEPEEEPEEDVEKDDKKDDVKGDSTDVEKDDKKDDVKGDSTDVKKDDKKDDVKGDSTDVKKDDEKDDVKGDSTDVKKDDQKDDGLNGEPDVGKPSFRIVLTGPFQFDIVFDEATADKAKSYAVMDLMGGVIKQGETVGGSRITVKNSGSYIVRVGRGYQKVDVK